MTTARREFFVDASRDLVWDLVGDPQRYPEWWPRMVEVRGDVFEEGSEFVLVSRHFGSADAHPQLLERVDDLHEVSMRCLDTGTFANWRLTDAQGGTFVDVQLGLDPLTPGLKVFNRTIARPYFNRWLDRSVDGLLESCTSPGASGGTGTRRPAGTSAG